MLALVVATSLVFAGEPPTEDALLELPQVDGIGPDGLRWSRIERPYPWVLSVGVDRVVQGGPEALGLERQVTGAATRLERTGAPWTWTERIRIRHREGAPLAQHPRAIQEVDATFTCVDATDPDSLWVDVELWWAPDRPPYGQERCRSKTPDIAWSSSFSSGGRRPEPGTVVGATILAVDSIQVGGQRRLAGGAAQPGPGGEVVAEVLTESTLKSSDPRLSRTRKTFRFFRPDGSALLPGKTELKATLTCEVYDYPPRP